MISLPMAIPDTEISAVQRYNSDTERHHALWLGEKDRRQYYAYSRSHCVQQYDWLNIDLF